MKQLILFRHAKTEERSLLGSDFKRDLKERGIEDAKKVSAYFNTHEKHPQIVLCSTAHRTSQTFEIFSKVTGYKGVVNHMEELYHASAHGLLDIIHQQTDKYNRVMLIGHNMGISQLANMLCGNGCPEMPTSGIAVIDFKNHIESQAGELSNFITPKTI